MQGVITQIISTEYKHRKRGIFIVFQTPLGVVAHIWGVCTQKSEAERL